MMERQSCNYHIAQKGSHDASSGVVSHLDQHPASAGGTDHVTIPSGDAGVWGKRPRLFEVTGHSRGEKRQHLDLGLLIA
jgi:hypothetical protein